LTVANLNRFLYFFKNIILTGLLFPIFYFTITELQKGVNYFVNLRLGASKRVRINDVHSCHVFVDAERRREHQALRRSHTIDAPSVPSSPGVDTDVTDSSQRPHSRLQRSWTFDYDSTHHPTTRPADAISYSSITPDFGNISSNSDVSKVEIWINSCASSSPNSFFVDNSPLEQQVRHSSYISQCQPPPSENLDRAV